MEIKIERLTYEKGLENKDIIATLMQDLDEEYDAEFCINKTDNLISFLEDGSAIVAAAFSEDTLIGYAWGYLRSVKTLRMHITQLVVDNRYRGMGIGKALLDFSEHECKKCGCVGLELNVAGGNTAAQKFYMKNNFVCESMFLSRNIEK